MIDTAQFVLIVITGLVGLLAWYGSSKASREAGKIGREVTTHTKELADHHRRIADVQERLEQSGKEADEKRRAQASQSLHAKLLNIANWISGLPYDPKPAVGTWNHELIDNHDLNQLDGLALDAGLSVADKIAELVAAVRRLNTAIELGKQRVAQRRLGARGGYPQTEYSSDEIDQWKRDKNEVAAKAQYLRQKLDEVEKAT